MSSKAQEVVFQNDILDQMQSHAWLLGESKNYDKELALYPEDVISFIKATQPEQWEKQLGIHPKNPEEALLKTVVRDLSASNKGTLWVLRNLVKDRGAKFSLCSFKPDHGLNPDAIQRYEQNILRVVPELVYSPNNYEGRIDLTLFVNGIPVATLELKSEFKQALDNAKIQYMKDRQPKDPKTKKPEPLLTFKRGALVHFAVSQYNVAMTTRLAGKSTFFLPFDQGTSEGAAGNDVPLTAEGSTDGYPTAYLWNEIFQKDNLLTILGRYIHLQVEEKEQLDGSIVKKETLIFPRYHQWSAVSTLLNTVEQEGTGEKYLIQHSAGSGKSNSIAWLSHQLASLHYYSNHNALQKQVGDKVFDSVIVITDRTVLDSQLQDTIYQFDHNEGMIARVNREEAQGSKSSQLASELKSGTSIIIVTIQTFPHVLEAIRKDSTLAGRSFAVIADEAHSSQTGTTARKLREVLMSEKLGAEQLGEDGELASEDILRLSLEARKGSKNISYFAFTATPKGKTLELFGRCPDPESPATDDNKPEPFHVYSMRQAIEEGFILDVLQNYTSYRVAYQLAHQNPDSDHEVDSKKAATKMAKWVRLHPHNIAQKVETIIEHFNSKVKHLLGGEAKAMVVTSSRLEAVRYKLAFEKYVANKGYENVNAMVAFSGEINDPDFPDMAFTERSMNPNLRGRDMRKAFDTSDYQVMLVANKFQTGFDQPKLVAMYVDKPLKGVECIQTLSRLNRTYKGKDKTFVLDFVNEPEEILEEFKVYFQTAELSGVSDPNLVYEIMEKLNSVGIYQWSEIENFVEAYNNKRTKQDKLANICKPAVERFSVRYKEATHVLDIARAELEKAKAENNDKKVKFAENSVKNAKEARDIIEVFKKDLISFCRYYEFSSQIVDFDDYDLEKLSIFAKHLHPLLRYDVLQDDIDLSDVAMTHFRLHEQREANLELGYKIGEEPKSYLAPTKESSGATPKDAQTELLIEIISRMNDLFVEDGLTEGDMVNYANTIAGKVSENDTVMDQLRNNSKEQAMLGAFSESINDAVIESMGVHENMAMKVLSNEAVAKGFAELMFDVLMKGLSKNNNFMNKQV
ncbi:type I restriction-modification system, restriction (R) subunit [Psychrosphaera saromensis]|uniref:Restriction endonuclease subunit R n=1 Tax=Psychrosphaera saromensis TaxID=716813 RepID=A0A2S7UTT1_9GAMM|nr:DEAD/DEAH box helicase family protein [Psychrosphaera saromensis]PQJ53138.1 restriction endonuclease subunit R [Psychrosphaera saromensis]GHB67746.1 type I restriction-modification system, restriction (R) subunit [Psychrosphaera saromensis]GLQ15106.1 type I restriction-modification system, restriction (R) subunit [Psychrosphaera saromensis]